MQESQGSTNNSGPSSADIPDKVNDFTAPAAEDDYRGLQLEQAADLARERGLVFRVIRENGRPLRVSMGHQPERLNFALVDGRVVTVTRG